MMLYTIFERAVFGIFVIVILLLLVVTKPLQKFIEYLEAHLTCHEPYCKRNNEEYGETFHERSWLLFWTYFVFSWLLAGSLYLTQIGFTINMGSDVRIGFTKYTYLIAAVLIVFMARVISTTSFIDEKYRKKIAPKFFTTVFGLMALGSFLSFINLFVLWIIRPQEIYNLLYVPIPLPKEVTFLDLLLNLTLIFGIPIFFATVMEEVINIFCKITNHERIYTPKKRHRKL